jgi:S1-C subfamily serine protease
MKTIALALTALVAAAVIGARVAFASPNPIGTGIVVVNTNLAYENGEAAGTGMVLTSNGEILTNNHVIAGATTISVVVPGTTHRYAASVVGYSVTSDVAVLKLTNASNLKTVSTSAAKVSLGTKVRAVGNAGGTGSLVTAAGRITGVGKTITAGDENGSSETLRGLLETNANVQAGDSGGPLLNARGSVIGMDTAASRASDGYGFASSSSPDAYAIPIARALTLAKQIAAGTASSAVHIGSTAFLGIQVEALRQGGALVAAVVPGGPADSAGLSAGLLITQIDGRAIATPTQVTSYLLTKKPGQQVSLAYTDQFGTAGSVTVTLGSGPPQ